MHTVYGFREGGKHILFINRATEQKYENLWKGYQGGYNGTTDHTQRQHTQAKNENENIISKSGDHERTRKGQGSREKETTMNDECLLSMTLTDSCRRSWLHRNPLSVRSHYRIINEELPIYSIDCEGSATASPRTDPITTTAIHCALTSPQLLPLNEGDGDAVGDAMTEDVPTMTYKPFSEAGD